MAETTTPLTVSGMEFCNTRDRAPSKTRMFNGVEKVSHQWNCLRKASSFVPPQHWETSNTHSQDEDLWSEDGDCLVHFHAEGSSKRPPSLKISFATVKLSKCSYLLGSCHTTRQAFNPSSLTDSGYDSSASRSSQESKFHELFIPPPANSSRDQAYAYHVTTRNFFALLTNKALVGPKLGLALVDLWERTKEWQPNEDATAKLMSYCEQQGYLAIAENVTHATAITHFAEKARIQSLWTNAFAHCVGMHERLDLSPDYQELSSYTKALIMRASLEMDLHLARRTRALGCFLEEELGSDRLGLSKPARHHLDRFRCFLHSHYVELFGYFPPKINESYDKRLWVTVRDDFVSLYELLADKASDSSIQNDSNASGGICCLQNTQAFDLRHGCDPLPHPCPLLPSIAPEKRSTDNQRTMRSLRLGRSTSTTKVIQPPRKALADATNTLPERTASRQIVQEYRRFEKSRPEEKISVQEARKVRWLLIYSALQMLKSILKAPQGVTEVESTSYALCVLTTGPPEWYDDNIDDLAAGDTDDGTTAFAPDFELTTPLPLTPDEAPTRPDSEGRISIHPDCEADNATEYFSNSRRSSVNALDFTPPPLRVTRPTRTASIRTSVSSGVNVLQRSLSVARRNSSRRSVQAPKHCRTNSFEIVGQGYGRQQDSPWKEALQDLEGQSEAPMHASVGTVHNPWQEFDFGLQHVAEEPTMHDDHHDSAFGLDYLHADNDSGFALERAAELERLEEEEEDVSKKRNSWTIGEAAFTAARWPISDEPASATTYSSEPDSLRSSYLADECDTPVTIYSSPAESPVSSKRGSTDLGYSYTSPRTFQNNPRSRHISLTEAQPGYPAKPSLNAGCYHPSGLPGKPTFAPALSRFSKVSETYWQLYGRSWGDLSQPPVRGTM